MDEILHSMTRKPLIRKKIFPILKAAVNIEAKDIYIKVRIEYGTF